MENNRDIHADRWVDDRLACIVPPASWEPDTAKGLDCFRQARRRRKGLTWAWAVAAMVTICAGALMFPATRVVAERCVNACLGTNRPAIRKLAPDFELPDASGKPVRLSDFRGKVVLLNFWATWCAPCNVEMPWLVEFQREYRDAGLVVVGWRRTMKAGT